MQLPNYQRARRLGERYLAMARFNGKERYLSVLKELEPDINKYHKIDIGQLEIPISMIRGTASGGRKNSFAGNYMPLLSDKSEFASKWEHVYDYQTTEGIHDPIKVYEYRRCFYVVEGNKRVSVLKYFDAFSVPAHIIRILPPRTNDEETQRYFEFLRFYHVAPIYSIGFSKVGGYGELARLVGQNLEDKWPSELVRTLYASYASFEKLFLYAGGEKLTVTTGDAFLVFLRFYPLDTLLTDSDELVLSHIRKLWGEFLAETGSELPTVLEDIDRSDSGKGINGIYPENYSPEKPLITAFFYDKCHENSSWIYGHELGRMNVESCFKGAVRTLVYENCSSEEILRRCIDDAVSQGAEICFTISPVQMRTTIQSAIHYPRVKFLNCSLNLPYQAVRTYYPRTYEVKFMLGVLAASMAENHKIAYLEGYPIYGIVADINAFALGASMVDPECRIYLRWRCVKEQNDLDPDIHIFSGMNMIVPDRPSREYGVYRKERDGSVQNLAFPVLDWGKYYEKLIRSACGKSWEMRKISRRKRAMNYWLGMPAGVADIFLSDHLSYRSVKFIHTLKRLLLESELDPFEGELHSQDGIIKKSNNRGLDREEIIEMNWLNDNIEGCIPSILDMTEEAQKTVQISGVGGTWDSHY